MGLRRLVVRHGEALRLHRRIKQWSSCGVGALLFVGFLIVCVYESLDLSFNDPAHATLVEPIGGMTRRLQVVQVQKFAALRPACSVESGDDEGAYPADPVIPMRGNPKKYKNAPAANKVGILVHIVLVGYMLLGLNTVCDIYFCGALDVMVDQWNIKTDVAGATFMAAGGSAPELFTSLIGAVITENDVGFGTIVGSAVFNVLAVIGACGMSAKKPIQLSWWPLFRDCSYYIFGLLLLAFCAYGKVETNACGDKIGGGSIGFIEAVVLFLAYVMYCVIMVFNEKLEAKVQALLDRYKGREKKSDHPEPMKVAPVIEINDTEAETEAETITEAKKVVEDKGPELRQIAFGGDGVEGVPLPPDNDIRDIKRPMSADLQHLQPLSLNSNQQRSLASLNTPLDGYTSDLVQDFGFNIPTISLPPLELPPPVSITVSGNTEESTKLIAEPNRLSAGLTVPGTATNNPKNNPRASSWGLTPQQYDEKKKRHHIEHHIRLVKTKAHLKPEQVVSMRRSMTASAGIDLRGGAGAGVGACQSNPDLRTKSDGSSSVAQDDGFADASLPIESIQEGEDDDNESIRSPVAVALSGEDVDGGSETSDDSDDAAALIQRPDDFSERIMWYFSLPIYAPLYYGIPIPTERCFLGTFVVALIWIAGFSFVLVYCVELFGKAILGGGNNVTVVMSFTILAAGTSIPDLVSSMAVAKAGEGDMAVSSSIGSNIFDILVGLPIPWMIKIALVEQDLDYVVAIRSPYIALYVLLLLFMVFCVIISIHMLGWKLNKQLGFCMAGLYCVFLSVVLPVELVNKGPYV